MEYKVFVRELTGERCDPKEMSRKLCADAINAYCAMECVEMPQTEEGAGFTPGDFMEEEKGKPYLLGNPVHFSVSHSGLLWLCMVGGAPCGIDIQQEQDCSYEKISARHFNEVEQEYIGREGLPGFFRLWTMREAYGKYTGRGFYGEMPSLVSEDGQPATEAGGVFFHEIEIGSGIYCTCCTGGKDDEILFVG